MTRNLKALGLALVVVLALGAMAASAAQAEVGPELTAFSTPGETHEHAILRATQGVGSEEDLFGIEGLSYSCETSTATATATGADATFTVEPSYSGCKTAGTFVTHVDLNGCDYLYHTMELIQEDEYRAWFEIECPTGNSITKTTTNLLGTKTICTEHVPPQTTGPVFVRDMTNASPTDVTIEEQIETLEVSLTPEGGAGCGGLAEGTYHSGHYTGTTTVTAENTADEPIDLEVSG